MLQFLHIENVAVVRSLDIEFPGGMITLTGETGAGKSIIIDSLNLLSGSRADKELIRSGADKAEVTAIFGGLSDKICNELSDIGFDMSEGSIMLSRFITQNSSSARINGRPTTVSLLREAASMLFGIHGQNDNLRLLDPKNHIEILDAFAQNDSMRDEYSQVYKEMLHVENEIDCISRDSREQARLSEMLKYQINDIDASKLRVGEEETLEALALKLRYAEKISKCCNLVQKALDGGGKGIGAIYLTDRAENALRSISDTIDEAQALSARLAEVKYELEDISASVSSLVDETDEDPTIKLDKTEARLETISKLKKKYGSTVEEVLEFRNDAAKKLEMMETADDRKAGLEQKLDVLRQKANAVAQKLSISRHKAATELTDSVIRTLSFLDMPKVVFEVAINDSRLNPFGIDDVEFLICTNVGEPLMPMAKIASGGELARIMLSLKNVLNSSDGVDTVIFDEIDTGISGKTSRKVGIKLKEIGKRSQVICVTHSAQIASLADAHIFVSKREVDGRTESSVKMLDDGEKVLEIARILGGIELTDAQIAAAREMIADGKKY